MTRIIFPSQSNEQDTSYLLALGKFGIIIIRCKREGELERKGEWNKEEGKRKKVASIRYAEGGGKYKPKRNIYMGT